MLTLGILVVERFGAEGESFVRLNFCVPVTSVRDISVILVVSSQEGQGLVHCPSNPLFHLLYNTQPQVSNFPRYKVCLMPYHIFTWVTLVLSGTVLQRKRVHCVNSLRNYVRICHCL